MLKRTFSALILTLLIMSMLTLAFNIQPVKASGTVYIKADGSIDPPDAPISSVDNITYTLTGNITSDAYGIVVERSNIIVDGDGYTLQGIGTGNGFYLSGIDNVTIKNTNIKNYEYGIMLYSSSNNTISRNNITANNGQGIRGDSANNNAISENNIIANNDRAIWFDWSSYTSVSGNNITNNRGGIYLQMSSNNSINGNNIAANIHEYGIALTGSFYIGGSSYNNIQGNNITNNEYGIRLTYSTYNNISENNVTANSRDGINLYGSSNYNSIFGNNVTANSRDGIYLYESSNNIISKNSITANNWGIYFYTSCYNNTIYHNNLINNTNQVGISYTSVNVWDDGYPSGGNYWSEYTGVDADADGIGDTPYTIDANNTDRYPLMAPFSMFNAGTWNETTYNADVVSNSTVSGFHFNPEEGPFLKFNVTGEEGTVGFCRVTIPKDLLWVEDGWTIFVGEESVNYTIIPDENYTYLYFTYNHSTKTVEIQGTHVIPEFPSTIILPLFTLTTLIATILLKKKRKTKPQLP